MLTKEALSNVSSFTEYCEYAEGLTLAKLVEEINELCVSRHDCDRTATEMLVILQAEYIKRLERRIMRSGTTPRGEAVH